MPGYLIDANLPRWFEPWSGPNYQFADDFAPSWSDTEVWSFAKQNDLTLVSKDTDFLLRAVAALVGPRLIHFRTGNLTMRSFHQIVTPIWDEVCQLSERARIVLIFRDRIETIEPG